MPNRILRDGILTSERVNSLSSEAEVFYRRLHSVVDDFGRYTAHPALLRAALYPLQLGRVSEAAIKRHLADCSEARLITLYEAEGKQFVEVLDFRQQVRAKESRCPPPPERQAPDATASKPQQSHINGAIGTDATPMHRISHASNGTSSDLSQVPRNQQSPVDAALMHSRCGTDAHLDGDGDGDGDDISSSADDGVDVALPGKQQRKEAFAVFWSAYPRRVGKVPAEKAWQTHNCTPLLDRILAALTQQKGLHDWRKEGGQYVPHPTTWINQHRWEDEPRSSASAGPTFIA